MATRTFSTVLYNGSDSDFRAWVQGIVDTLKAIAASDYFDLAGDSGQIADPIVAVRPAVSTSGGYLILKTADTHHATNPTYWKFEFGSGSTQILPQMWVTIGTGSDGAGAITGVRISRTPMGRNAQAGTGTVYEHAASWGDGWFFVWTGINVGFGLNFGWERNRNTDGTTKDDCSYWWSETTTTFGLVWATLPKPPTAIVSYSSGSSGPGMPVLFSPQNVGGEYTSLFGEVPVFPVEPFFGRRQPPLLSMAVVSGNDVGSGVVIQTTMYGATKQFRRVSDVLGKYVRGTTNVYLGATAQQPALCCRWE